MTVIKPRPWWSRWPPVVCWKHWRLIGWNSVCSRCRLFPIKRIWYKGGEYMDVAAKHAWEYENDPDWDRTETVEDLTPGSIEEAYGLWR